VKFDIIGGNFVRRFDLIEVWFNKETDRNSTVMEQINQCFEPFALPGHFEAAFCGQFLSPLRHQGDEMRLDAEGDFNHGFIRRDLQIELRLKGLPQNGQIPILDMSPVLTKMHDQSVRPGEFDENRSRDRVWFVASPGLTQGRYVIDIDSKPRHPVTIPPVFAKT
jgi:hypothetical protein